MTQKPLTVDLNCDMGESFGAWRMGQDAAIMPYISSANIACGYHAGDPLTMRHTVRLALEHGVAIGAHPGLPDLVGFGRREIQVSPEEVEAMVLYQVGAMQSIAQAEGTSLHHVKPHGALYNMAARSTALAEAIVRAVRQVNPQLMLYGLANSELIKAAEREDVPVAQEVFADRTYSPDGSLTPRTQPNALITDQEQAVQQVLQMVQQSTVQSIKGVAVPLQADTVCLHGDGTHALAFARLIRERLQQENIKVQAL